MLEQKYSSFDLRGLTLIAGTGAWLVGILLASLLLLPSLALLIALGGTLACLILLWQARQGRFILFLLLCFLLGAWRYTTSSPVEDSQSIARFIGSGKVVVRGSVADEPRLEGRSRAFTVSVSEISMDGGTMWRNTDGQLAVQTTGTVLDTPYGPNYSDSVEVQGKLQAPEPYNPPGVFASMAFPRISVRSSGGNPVIAFLYHLRITLATIIEQSLPQPAAALLIAIVFSLRTPALKPLTAAFNATGTAHLLAPSGLKITLLAGLIASSMPWGAKAAGTTQPLLPAQKRGGWRHWLTTMVVVISIFVYTLLSGAGPAAVRAGIMGVLMVIAPRIGRTYHIYTALALAALLMSLVNPFVLWDVGFQLSFLGTLGITLYTPLFQDWLHPLARFPGGHYVAETIAVTLAAQVATLPIFAVTFHDVALVAPIANLLTVPLLSTMILLGIVLCCIGMLFAPAALLCGWVAWPLLWYISFIIPACAYLPAIPVSTLDSKIAWGYYVMLTLFTCLAWQRIRAAQGTQGQHHSPLIPGLSRHMWHLAQVCAALLVILVTGGAVATSPSNELLTVTFLDVGPAGQPPAGEAILLHTPDGKTMLIDGGPDIASLSQELDGRLPPWQRSLDAVLLSAAKADHMTGLLDVIQRYRISEAIDAGMLHPTTTYALWKRTIIERSIHYIPVVQGDTIPLGTQVVLQVLWPPPHLHKGSNEVRDNGLVMRLVAPGMSILFLGEAAQSNYALSGMLNSLAPNYLQAQIVQIVGERNTSFPNELEGLLQMAHPSLLLVTPPSIHTKRGSSLPAAPGPVFASTRPYQIVQTAQVGSVETNSGQSGWSMSIV